MESQVAKQDSPTSQNDRFSYGTASHWNHKDATRSNSTKGDDRESQKILIQETTPAFIRLISSTTSSSSSVKDTPGLFEFCWRVLWKATIGTVISDDPEQVSSYDACGIPLRAFDADFPKLVGGAPAFLFKDAVQGREHVLAAMAGRTKAFEKGKSPYVRARHEAFKKLGVTDPADLARADMSVVWASVANTVPTAFWTLFHLIRDKEALSAVRKELESARNSSEDQSLPKIFSVTELESMTCLDSVIQETLRLYSESITA